MKLNVSKQIAKDILNGKKVFVGRRKKYLEFNRLTFVAMADGSMQIQFYLNMRHLATVQTEGSIMSGDTINFDLTDGRMQIQVSVG